MGIMKKSKQTGIIKKQENGKDDDDDECCLFVFKQPSFW